MNDMIRRTKIVVTLGPSLDDIDVLERVILEGAVVFRANFSHGDINLHETRINNVRRLAEKQGMTVAILVDLQGPKIRIGRFKDKKIQRDPQSNEIDKKWMEEKIKNGEAIKVTDKGDLEESLRNYSNSDQGEYKVAFYYKNQSYSEMGVFKNSFVPDFVKRQLN